MAVSRCQGCTAGAVPVRSVRRTATCVAQDQIEAKSLAERFEDLEFGKIARLGSPCEPCRQPVNLFLVKLAGSLKTNVPGHLGADAFLIEDDAEAGRITVGTGRNIEANVDGRIGIVCPEEQLHFVDRSANFA